MTKKLAFLSVFTAFAMILTYIEILIPINIGIPGVKLGLANLIIVLAIYNIGAKEAILINIIRIVLTGILFGNVFSILFSFSGALFSFIFMVIVKKMKVFSIITTSIVGGFMHNIGQIIVASFLVGTYSILYYAPILMLVGIFTGGLLGFIANILDKNFKKLRW